MFFMYLCLPMNGVKDVSLYVYVFGRWLVKKTMARGRPQRSARRFCTASSGMDFYRPPPSIGWALTALRRGERRAPDDDDDDDDDDEGGDEEEVDGR